MPGPIFRSLEKTGSKRFLHALQVSQGACFQAFRQWKRVTQPRHDEPFEIQEAHDYFRSRKVSGRRKTPEDDPSENRIPPVYRKKFSERVSQYPSIEYQSQMTEHKMNVRAKYGTPGNPPGIHEGRTLGNFQSPVERPLRSPT